MEPSILAKLKSLFGCIDQKAIGILMAVHSQSNQHIFERGVDPVSNPSECVAKVEAAICYNSPKTPEIQHNLVTNIDRNLLLWNQFQKLLG